jgi:hypothetical protein
VSSGYHSLRSSLTELHSRNEDVALCLSEALDDEALKALMRLGLGTRFPEESKAWEERVTETEKCFQTTFAERQAEIHATLEKNSGRIQTTVREAVFGEILKAFP